jgi:3-oxoacyl-[acyl-carrier protein] reductase
MTASAYAQLDLAGEIALVTGASSGIGAAVAKLLASRGAAVVVNFRSGEERATKIVDAITRDGGRAFSIAADVTKADDLAKIRAAAQEAYGPITILVNNAGAFWEVHPFLDIGDELWDRSLDLNLRAVVRACETFLPDMLAAGHGRIVNLSSIVTQSGGPGETAHYAVAKAGVETLTRSLAREHAATGVIVNAVAPGLIDTPVHDDNRERFDRLQAAYAPVGRAGTPEEVAEVVAFLASPAASYMTAQTLHVNGGRL